jgi:hypothetical protein
MENKEQKIIPIAIAVGLSVIISTLISFYLIRQNVIVLEGSFPLIAIAGYESAEKKFDLNTSSATMAATYERINQKIERLKSLGYIVIDERVIISAPDSARIKTDLVIVPENNKSNTPLEVSNEE